MDDGAGTVVGSVTVTVMLPEGVATPATTLSTASSAAPTFFVPDLPVGDAARLRLLADELESAADGLLRAAGEVRSALSSLGPYWHGAAARAFTHPVSDVCDQLAVVASWCRRAADTVRHAAHRVEAAHHRHWWSWQRIRTVAEIVAVTAGGVLVTVATAGAAAPEVALADAALVEGEVVAAGAAVAGAASAALDVAQIAAEGSRLLAGLRTLVRFIRPQLVQAQMMAGSEAAYEVLRTGRFRLSRVAAVGLDALLVPVLGEFIAAEIAGVGRWGRVFARPLGHATASFGGNVVQQEVLQGHVDWGHAGKAAAAGFGTELGLVVPRVRPSLLTIRDADVRPLPIPFDPVGDGRLVRADWLPRRGATYAVTREAVRMSQATVGDFDHLVEQIGRRGWDGDRVRVVLMPDRRLTTIDHRRLFAAERLDRPALAVVWHWASAVSSRQARTVGAQQYARVWRDLVEHRVGRQWEETWRRLYRWGSYDDVRVGGAARHLSTTVAEWA